SSDLAGRGRPTASRGAAASSGGGSGRPPSSGGGRGRPPGGRGPAPRGGTPRGKGPRGKKQRRRRSLKILIAVLAGLLVLGGVFVGVVYASTDVPSPDSVQSAQTTVIYYNDGKTEMARLGSENRTNVTLAQISKPAQRAVLAAENRSFYSDPGISFTGIVRAAWNNVSGGSTQGGSTITQQYVKNAFLTADQTFSRKFKELFLAIKLDNTYSKDQILQNYLNTIYFGRGAYGIEAAANTYFGVHASQLTAQQGAVLAVLIRSPSHYDPAENPVAAKDRWGLVLDAMVTEHWLSGADRKASVYPPLRPKSVSSLGIPSGPQGLIVQRVLTELRSKGYTDQQLRAGGLRITSTVNKGQQDAAVAAVADVMQGEPGNLRQALVAVNPKTGGVTAYYGGPKATGASAIDYAMAQRQPGSSVKPYVLATGLERGISVTARRNGSSPQTFPDRPDKPVRNSGNAGCAACTLQEAITRSLNTTFYGLTYELGATNVRKTMLKATGLPEKWTGGILDGDTTLADPKSGGTDSGLGIGQYEMRPIDQAVGFATFASGGIQRPPYFVAKVTDNKGAVLMQNNGEPGTQAVPPDVANDVTYAIEGVAAWSHRSLDGGRPVGSKTGTVGSNDTDNSDAWMVGYTPSISAAVWMGSDGNQPIVNASGRIIYGAGLPGAIWQQFMNAVLQGTPVEPLPTAPKIQGDTGEGVPAPVTTSAPATTTAAPITTKAPAVTTKASTKSTATTSSTASTSTSSASTSSSTASGVPVVPGGGGARPSGGAGHG
ncbi:MAG: Peptidoglycan glycosyltransferase, partial [Blastococcus sp.]|nr:Peptidoglycan glycosyltransferase [Blastococcus sp.]